MITTLLPILAEVSAMLNESSTDITAKRISFGNRAIRRILRVRKWSWSKLKHTLDVDAGVQTYDLSEEISDYNPMWGIYEVYIGGEKVTPIHYNQRNNTTGVHFYLEPESTTIGFTNTLDGTETIEIWYAPRWTSVAASDTTFALSIPEDMLGGVCLLIKSMVHGAKRQRYDERNALIDYKEEIEELVLQDSSNKILDLPQTVAPVSSYHRVRRSYVY